MNRVCIEKDEKGDIVGIYSDEPIRFFEANERDILIPEAETADS